jgi:hypothetical protein
LAVYQEKTLNSRKIVGIDVPVAVIVVALVVLTVIDLRDPCIRRRPILRRRSRRRWRSSL